VKPRERGQEKKKRGGGLFCRVLRGFLYIDGESGNYPEIEITRSRWYN
jgi:hypothetical protein